jgi:ligand-binding SRPBCC domain-containing protein
MAVIELETIVQAPPTLCYSLKLDVQQHVAATAHTQERIVAGRTSGRLELGELITWEARHLGVRQRLTVQVTIAEPPFHFRDEMRQGAFHTMSHDHYFEPLAGGQATRMRDVFRFESPGGWLGHCFDTLFLKGYLTRFLQVRNAQLQQQAEAVYAVAPTGAEPGTRTT